MSSFSHQWAFLSEPHLRLVWTCYRGVCAHN